MNPEFQRNVWLELTPRRIVLMAALLGLAFFASAVSDAKDGLVSTARALYYGIVVIWGTRNAATSVVGEIRDRTWDMQLLSSIGPGAMTWGKLFGSTIYNWLGGAICLAVILSDAVAHKGPVPALIDLVYFIAVGAISQAAALLASLVAVKRRQAHSRLDVFIYQAVGLVAAIAVSSIWSIVDPATFNFARLARQDVVHWWGQVLDMRAFLLASLAVFTAWTLVGCYREMRIELKMKNGALVWLGFLIFIGLYVAGFDIKTKEGFFVDGWQLVAQRVGLAASTYACLTYLMVILEPKDSVLFRWLSSQLAAGRLDKFLNGLQAWMMSYVAALICGVVLIGAFYQGFPEHPEVPPVVAAALGFLTRDVWIFVLMRSFPGRRRGDLAALAVMVALYGLAPTILAGLKANELLMIFYPKQTDPAWLGALVAWAEGAAVAVFALGRTAFSKAPVVSSA